MDLQSMLTLPRDQMRALAPRTVVWAAGGTRRQATLAGMAINATYHRWGWQQHLERVALLFDLGVQTLFTPLLGPPQAREIGPYREVLFKQLSQTVGGAESLE